MKATRTSVLAALVLVGAAACGSSRAPGRDAPPSTVVEPSAATEEVPVTTGECLERFEVGQEGSVLSEQRSLGKGADDFAARYAAATIDPAAQVPIEATKAYQLDGRPLLWFTADKAAVVVDARALSDLAVADVTRMGAGERAEVGRIAPGAVGHLGGRDLVKFLIAARAIGTYVHIGAELCLASERADAGAYHASFTGEHTYFTNKKHTVALRFDVDVDAAGVIVVSTPAS